MSNAVTARLGTRDGQAPATRPSSQRHIATMSHCRSFRRRGSALMVALALLLMLAVFASLFLTSSRYDVDASAADLDTVRMDLYAEGLFQYVQNCLVAGLWGFDDKPLNYDGVDPYPVPAGTLPTAIPGPDSPFDYFGGEVLATDPDGSVAGTGVRNGDETFFYPNFWLTDPRLQTVAGSQVFQHAAFAPAPAAQVPFHDATYATSTSAQWTYADLNADGRADTPWLFARPLGNGLYVRAAVRVEDTSSRVNLNVARWPLVMPVAAAGDLEQRVRQWLYPGYPVLNDAVSSWFPLLANIAPSMTDPKANPPWVERLGAFVSEMDLASLTNSIAVATLDDGGSGMPGRYGMATANSCPDALVSSLLLPQARSARQRLLLGDPSDPGAFPDNPRAGDPGRLGELLCRAYNRDTTSLWLPLGAPLALQSWRTFDPDGLSRRIDGSADHAGDTDRPFSTDDTFDLMGVFGGQLGPNPAPNEDVRYRSGLGSLPTRTRLEQLWPDFLVNNTAGAPLQYRRMFTTYSWTLNLCPYGEDPYHEAEGAGSPRTFRKVDINTCTGRAFEEAIKAANRHPMYDAAIPDTTVAQLVANFLDYRDRPMTDSEFRAYMTVRGNYVAANPAATVIPTPDDAMLEWDEQAWQNHVLQASGNPPPWTPAMDAAYTQFVLANWGGALAPLRAEIIHRVSHDTPSQYNAVAYGTDRFPFITEVYVNIMSFDPAAPNPEVAWAAAANTFAVELFNPYLESLSIEDYQVVVSAPTGTTVTIPLVRTYSDISPGAPGRDTTIPAGGRLVVSNDAGIASALQAAGIANYDTRTTAAPLVIYPESRIVLQAPAFAIDESNPVKRVRTADFVVLDELPSVLNTMVYPTSAISAASPYVWSNTRWDTNGGFWLHSNNAWSVGAVGPAALGAPNGTGPATPFYAVPSIANLAAATFPSPGDLQNLLTVGPDPALSATVRVDAAWPAGDVRIPLFHRSYLPDADDSRDLIVNRSGSGIAVLQSLMDFVTVTNFLNEGVDENADGVADPVDYAKLRVPGRLNINTIGSDFIWLDGQATHNSPLLFIDCSRPADATFWQTLIGFRDLTLLFQPIPGNNRDQRAVGAPLAGYPNHPGIEQLGELCNLQDSTNPIFPGFWQDRASLNVPGQWTGTINTNPNDIPDFLLPAQHARRFARNANLLTTRSDTYMVTVRVEIVRPQWTDAPPYDGVMQASEITAIPTLGQKEYMYLTDRSYCAKAPQQAPVAGDPAFTGRANPDYTPPRVWRMSIPRYAAYGG